MVAGGKGGKGDWDGREYMRKLNIYIFLKTEKDLATPMLVFKEKKT